MWEENAKRCGLQLVQARVDAHVLEGLLVLRAVEAEHADPLVELLVANRHEPAVAESEEVFGRVEAECRRDACCRDPGGAERLRGVFDDRQAELREWRERRRTAEEVHSDDRPRLHTDRSAEVAATGSMRLA